MPLLSLKAENFRNLKAPDITFHPQFNIIHGVNGSGKTSLLEAIHFLCLARSFRSHQVSRIICDEAEHFTLFGTFLDSPVKNWINTFPFTSSDKTAHAIDVHIPMRDGLLSQKEKCLSSFLSIPVGIEKRRQGDSTIKINGEIVRSTAELASLQPLQLIHPATFHLIDAGPQYRRQFLDWGVFHVEPSFFSVWKRFEIALKQRNSALRQQALTSHIQAWDKEWVPVAIELNKLRRSYFSSFIPVFKTILAQLTKRNDIMIQYSAGWDDKVSLHDILVRQLERDRAIGYTQHGPQRADISIKVDNMPASDILSRGEQKLAICALRLAQGLHLQQQSGKQCAYLIDDLMSELDSNNRDILMQVLKDTQAQIFITALDSCNLENLGNMFHVEHGQIC